jgi:hypothetical protein
LTGTGASPITISGLTALTSYTFTVTASTPGGTSPASAASNSVTPTAPLVIGDAYGGGFYAGQISTAGNSVADYNLVVGPVSSAESRLQFKTSNTGVDPTSVIDGPSNSAAMNNASHPAAQFCEAVTAGGYTDWYMPARNELEVLYFNLKPDTTENITNSGINANAVPARASNYTAGNPAQTSAAVFQTSGAQVFVLYKYWSSSENVSSGTAAVNQIFTNGYVNTGQSKTNSFYVRAIRRIAV